MHWIKKQNIGKSTVFRIKCVWVRERASEWASSVSNADIEYDLCAWATMKHSNCPNAYNLTQWWLNRCRLNNVTNAKFMRWFGIVKRKEKKKKNETEQFMFTALQLDSSPLKYIYTRTTCNSFVVSNIFFSSLSSLLLFILALILLSPTWKIHLRNAFCNLQKLVSF